MNVVFWIFLLITPYVHAGSFCGCICGGETEKITVITIEPAEQENPTKLNDWELARQMLLTLPRPLSRTKSPGSAYTDTPTPRPPAPTPEAQSMEARRSFTPRIQSLPGTPVSPITPLDDNSPSSPESPFSPYEPLSPPERIITYPEHIRAEQRKARYQQAAALAHVFIEQLPKIRKEQHRNAQINGERRENRRYFATMLLEGIATKRIEYAPRMFVCNMTLTITPEDYDRFKDIGITAYGRPLTEAEVDSAFAILHEDIPYDLKLVEFDCTLKYFTKHTTLNTKTGENETSYKSHTIKLTKDRLPQLEPLMHPRLTTAQAETIMDIISVKLSGMKRSLRQEMIYKLPEERDQLEVTREIIAQDDQQKHDLNQIARIIRPRIKERF